MRLVNLGWFKWIINAQSIFIKGSQTTNQLLQEDGFFLTQEDGGRINL